MKDVVELDEDDIIRALSVYVARERDWSKTGHSGIVTILVTPGEPGKPVQVSARVEKWHESKVSFGKPAPPADPVW